MLRDDSCPRRYQERAGSQKDSDRPPAGGLISSLLSLSPALASKLGIPIAGLEALPASAQRSASGLRTLLLLKSGVRRQGPQSARTKLGLEAVEAGQRHYPA